MLAGDIRSVGQSLSRASGSTRLLFLVRDRSSGVEGIGSGV